MASWALVSPMCSKILSTTRVSGRSCACHAKQEVQVRVPELPVDHKIDTQSSSWLRCMHQSSACFVASCDSGLKPAWRNLRQASLLPTCLVSPCTDSQQMLLHDRKGAADHSQMKAFDQTLGLLTCLLMNECMCLLGRLLKSRKGRGRCCHGGGGLNLSFIHQQPHSEWLRWLA